MADFEFETKIEEAVLTVSFDYDKGDDGVMYYPDMSGQPPTPPSIDCVEVTFEFHQYNINTKKEEPVILDVTELIYALGYEQVIEEECFKHIEKQ